MSQEDLYERLTKVETVQKEHERKLNSQLEKNETLIEMKTLMAIQIEDGKKRDTQMEKFEGTLLKVNENLTNLNNSQQQLGNRVSDIESTLNEQKVDPVKLFKSILSYFATSMGSIAVAYLIWLLTK